MDQLQTRLDALEQQMHAVNRRLRWWRGLACSLAVLGLLGWGIPLSLTREDAPDKGKGEKGLAQRVAALEELLKHFSREKHEIFITGANLHLINGPGSAASNPATTSVTPVCTEADLPRVRRLEQHQLLRGAGPTRLTPQHLRTMDDQ
jgi:hypothetical protein